MGKYLKRVESSLIIDPHTSYQTSKVCSINICGHAEQHRYYMHQQRRLELRATKKETSSIINLNFFEKFHCTEKIQNKVIMS